MGFSLGGALKGAIGGFSTGGPWGALAGAAVGGAYEGYQESSAKKAAKKAQQQSKNWWHEQFNTAKNETEYQMQNRIQWSAADALKAGINPAVAAGAPANVTGAPMPNSDLFGGINANANTMNAISNMQQANTAEHAMRSQTMLNESNSYKNYTEAGLMDRNTAAREVEAHAAEMQAQARINEVDTAINRINALLPGELKGQALELAIKAQQGRLNENEMKYLDSVGLTKSQMIQLGSNALNIINDQITGHLNRNNFTLNNNSANKNYRIETFNSRGKFSGAKVVKYN